MQAHKNKTSCNNYKAVRPIVFEVECESYPYGIKGTAFIVLNKGNYFLVSLRHNVGDYVSDPNDFINIIRVFSTDDSRDSLPFDMKYRLDVGDDNELRDLLILKINKSEIDLSNVLPIDISKDISNGIISPKNLERESKLKIVGFPAQLNSVCYETKAIKSQRCILDALYKEPFPDHRYFHTLTVKDNLELNCYDGLSGSAVFAVNCNNYKTGLVGILVRGGASSRTAHFISAEVIRYVTSQ